MASTGGGNGTPSLHVDGVTVRFGGLVALDALAAADVAQPTPDSLPDPVPNRVALARAPAAKPTLLLLDGPAGGLDADDMAQLGALIGRLRGEIAVALVEHHMDLVMS